MALQANEVENQNTAERLPAPVTLKDPLRNPGIEIIGEREGGLIECYVPFELIDNEEVPVKEEWAASLAKQMSEIAEAEGGSGQHTPVMLGKIPGEPRLKIMDGFHRSEGLRLLGEERVYATVKETDWNGLYDYRIFTAKDHRHVRFSRVVQWMQEVWQHSGLQDKMEISQAVLLTRFDSDGSKLGLLPEDVIAAKEWVSEKENGWGIAAMTIHGYLQVAETVDPQLVHSTREKRRSDLLDAPTQTILNIFSKELPDNFEMQNLVMITAMQVRLPGSKGPRSMSGPEIRALCRKVKTYQDVSVATKAIQQIDWQNWEPEYGETKNRALRRAYDPRHKGAAVLKKTVNEVSGIRARVSQSVERDEEIMPGQKVMIREARAKAIEIISELGALVTELSSLIGEAAPVHVKPAAARSARQPEAAEKIEDILSSRKQKETIEEHEGLLPMFESAKEQRMTPELIRSMVFAYLRGELEDDDLPIPESRWEQRQFKMALAKAHGEIADEDKPADWEERFLELQAIQSPDIAMALRSNRR